MASERRPYHLVADSVWREAWTNDEFALVGRLQAFLHERWRTDRIMDPEQAATVLLSAGQMQAIAGVESARTARARFEHLPMLVTCSVVAEGSHTRVTWPKWPEYQKMLSQTGGKAGGKRPPSASSVQRPASSEPPTGGAAGAPSPWLNLLAKEPGTAEAKAAFLERELPVIEAEAEAFAPRDRRAQHAKTRSLILRYWRHRLRNPGVNGRGKPISAKPIVLVEPAPPAGAPDYSHAAKIRRWREDKERQERFKAEREKRVEDDRDEAP